MRLGLGGAGVDAQLKNQRARSESDRRASAGARRSGGAVDERALVLPRSRRRTSSSATRSKQMLPADPGAVGRDVTFGAAPETNSPCGKSKALPCGCPRTTTRSPSCSFLDLASLSGSPVWLAAARSVVRAHPDEASLVSSSLGYFLPMANNFALFNNVLKTRRTPSRGQSRDAARAKRFPWSEMRETGRSREAGQRTPACPQPWHEV